MEVVSLAKPQMSLSGFLSELASYHSPALSEGEAIYYALASYPDGPVDPAFALAVFVHESCCGTRGVAVHSRNWGNLRWGPRARRIEGGFAYYGCFLDSALDFARLLHRYARGEIVGGHPCPLGHTEHVTPEAIFPHYAPSADRNNPSAYAGIVRRLVNHFREAYPVTETASTLLTEVEGLKEELARVDQALAGLEERLAGLEERLLALAE